MSRLLFVTQRYGDRVTGGAEAAVRSFAEQLARRGNHVEVLTSTATDYTTWHDDLPSGTSVEGGVGVTRLPVARPRDPIRFNRWNARLITRSRPVALAVQSLWLREQGPVITPLAAEVRRRAPAFDSLLVAPYVYASSVEAVRTGHGRLPVVMHPFAHDEPTLSFPLYDGMFRQVDGLAYSTPEEAALVERRFAPQAPSCVVGIGVERPPDGEPQRFRSGFNLNDDPYLLMLGRVEGGKGSLEAFDMFCAYQDRHPGSRLRLVVVGPQLVELTAREDVVCTGFVDDQMKADALAGCLALWQPSYFESFSLVLCEAWWHGRPALVQGHCDVLRGQATRAGGGLPYQGFPSWEASVEELLTDPALGDELGRSGRQYVESVYSWDAVLNAHRVLLERAAEQADMRRTSLASLVP